MIRNNSYGSTSANIRELIQIGLMSALVYVATAAINVPIGPGGVIHLGDSMVFVAAILLGWKNAAISGAIGMTIFDLLSPYAIWAPYTFVIKGIMGAIAGLISHSSKRNGKSFVWNIIAIIISGVWMITGYYFAEAIIYSNILSPLASIPANFFQIAGGAVIAIPLSAMLKRTGYFK